MLERIIRFSLSNKLIIFLWTLSIIGFGLYSVSQITIGAVPDITNNQVQVITTTRDLSTIDVEKYITQPVELEMANLPGVKEIRSISKFGLSVVTIVFEDKMGTYLPRQLIAEKIGSASANIPESFGTPAMGPITTGLGEIYQYTLEVDPEFRSKYTTTELRTIQDWIVKRQLSGIPGVVEVNTWGGHLKQLEVTINPQRLKSFNISLPQVFQALANNNSVAGGGYIEKDDKSYFIRGEGSVTSTSDVASIVVDQKGGIPVYVADIAEVKEGHATRFGAITGNGEGEKVLGQVMMLKGANVNEVIDAVKARVDKIQTTLPEGIKINGFLDRSELIGRTTDTIRENLLLGCLIVIFAVLVLLGDWRTSLIIASVIPISLLFAISLMYITGVDANLMSLGAIDFGIIIDGSIIIVEFVVSKTNLQHSSLATLPSKERKSAIDLITLKGTSKMMHSAIFGQLIIMIVFIPILTLRGIEGKLFTPMALTFCFALLGAMIMCFTYVPVITSIVLGSSKHPKYASSYLIRQLQHLYKPVVNWSLEHAKMVVISATLLLGLSVFIFSRLGGEFVPTLDEGDFVIQPILETGTSLSKTIEITTSIERVIQTFPEVEQVITRIGAAEIPTDPMSMEETDIIITLLPKGLWISANTKDQLADLIKKKLETTIPGVTYEFTQPIEMRFNELITGVRADLAIKIFGEDLEILAQKAAEVEQLLNSVRGASDISVEKLEGLPQMLVKYDRRKIARYGLNVADVNEIIIAGFAGKTAGVVFEGERKFDLVLRYGRGFQKSLEDIKNATVINPAGIQIPLREVANIRYTEAPSKVSRDNTRRRIVVGVNVRNRDLASVVAEAREKIESEVVFPPGYFVDYGGQFENLENAQDRLQVAVPIALSLIFLLLFFAFRDIGEALMVFSAIPLAALGGILFLWVRDLPFSISAGVGFIALFGIAVLNGIVLIEHYKSVVETGPKAKLKDQIVACTEQRLRPVILTASAAALGFLPMAMSTSAGAEVQRPLATVVIGGLITATLLTLLVLPSIYYLRKTLRFRFPNYSKAAALIFLATSLPNMSNAQSQRLTLDEAIKTGLHNSYELQIQSIAVQQGKLERKTSFDLNKTQVFYSYDENNIAPNNFPLHIFGIGQQIPSPFSATSKRKYLQSRLDLQSSTYDLQKKRLEKEIKDAFFSLAYQQLLRFEIASLDSLYEVLVESAQKKFELGETGQIALLIATSERQQLQLEYLQTEKNIDQARLLLQGLIRTSNWVTIENECLLETPLLTVDTSNYLGRDYYEQLVQKERWLLSFRKSQYAPDVNMDLFTGRNAASNQRFDGIEVGLGFPIFSSKQRIGVKQQLLEIDKARLVGSDHRWNVQKRMMELQLEVNTLNSEINYFLQEVKPLNDRLLKMSMISFQNGEIDVFELIRTLTKNKRTREGYLYLLYQYHMRSNELLLLNNQSHEISN